MRNNVWAFSRGRFPSDPGSPIKIEYAPKVLDDGSIELVEVGKINTDEEIESYAESCSLDSILSKYLNGDLSVVNRHQEMYLDLTEMPKTYAELLQHAINAESGFEALPVAVKGKYENDWRKWLTMAGTDEWFADLGIDPKEPPKEVNTDES